MLNGTHAVLLEEPVPEDDATMDVPPLLLLVPLATTALLESTAEDAVELPVDVDTTLLLDPPEDEEPAVIDEEPAVTDEAPTDDEDTATEEDRTTLLEEPVPREEEPALDEAGPPLVDDDEDDDALEPLSDGLVHPNPTAANTTSPPDPRHARMRLLQPCGPVSAGVCAGNITLAHQTGKAQRPLGVCIA